MSTQQAGGKINMSDRNIISIIGDQDTVTGMLLAGIGHIDSHQRRNYLIVDAKTPENQIESTFEELTSRKDIAILLINQHVAERIRHVLDDWKGIMPAILEIPSKDHPYDPSKDSVLKRVNALFGQE